MLNNRLISMLIGLGMLSACSDADERKLSAQNDNGADVSLSIGGGKDHGGAAKISLKLPQLKLGRGDVDIDGVRLYPGSRVTGFDLAGESGDSEGSVMIRFDADAKPASVRDYFINAFKAKGLTVTAQGDNITGRDSEGKPFTISLAEQGAGTRGTVNLGTQSS